MNTINSLLMWTRFDECFDGLSKKVCADQRLQPVVKAALKAIATFAALFTVALPLAFASSTLFAVGLSVTVLATLYTFLKAFPVPAKAERYIL